MFKKMIITTAMLVMATGITLAGTTKFINVELTHYAEEGGEIKLRLPMSMLESMVPSMNEALAEAALEAENHNVDLAGIWNEIRNAGPTQFVAINDGPNKITVETTDTDLKVIIQDGEQDINITVPLELGDALLSGDEGFDVGNLLATLENFQGDLVTIVGSEMDGRIWVD